MFKKLFILFILILSAVLWICYKNKNFNDKSVTIQFASWGSESEIGILKPILADFEKENPDIKVDFMHIPQNYFQKIHLLFASNTAPDVLFLNNQYLPIYAKAGVLENLSAYISENEYKQYYPKALASLSWKADIYAIPRDISNLVIFYNKNLFDKYKVPYPHSGWTYDEFLNTAQKLTHLPEVFGISFEEMPLFYLPYMMMYGGWTQEDTLNFFKNDVLKRSENAKGLAEYANLRNKYHVAPYKSESASTTMAQLFLQGRLGMHLSGRWLVPKYRQEADFDWDIVEFPRINNKAKSVVPLDASGWAVSKSSKHKQQAIKLVKYLSSKSSCEKFTKSGLIVPARKDVANSKAFLDGQKPYSAKIFLDIIDSSYITPVTVNYKEILDVLKNKNEELFNKFQ